MSAPGARAAAAVCRWLGAADELCGEPVRQRDWRAVVDERVGGAVDDGRRGDDVPAGRSGVDQRAEEPGGGAERRGAGPVGRPVVPVGAAGAGADGVGGRDGAAGQGGEGVLAGAGGGVELRRLGLGDVGVDDDEAAGAGGDADAVGAAGPGAGDAFGVEGGALLPAGVPGVAVRVRAVAAGLRVVGVAGRLSPGRRGNTCQPRAA